MGRDTSLFFTPVLAISMLFTILPSSITSWKLEQDSVEVTVDAVDIAAVERKHSDENGKLKSGAPGFDNKLSFCQIGTIHEECT